MIELLQQECHLSYPLLGFEKKLPALRIIADTMQSQIYKTVRRVDGI